MKFKRVLGIVLCGLMMLGLLGPMTKTAEAKSYTVTVTKGSRKDLSVLQEADSITVTLSGRKGTVTLKGKPTWVTAPSSSTSNKITISVQKNTGSSIRTGDVVYQDASDNKLYTLRITQDKYSIGTSVGSITLPVTGAGKSITVSANGPITYTKSNWITVTQTSSTTSNGQYIKSYTISASANPNGTAPSGYVEFVSGGVAKKRVSITQSANTISGVPASKSVGNEATSFSFTVTVGTGTVTASSSNTSVARTSVSGNRVTVSTYANITNTSNRTSTITVKAGNVSKSFVLTQAGCRTNISFPNQTAIEQDSWTKERGDYLTTFYDRLIAGAQDRGDITASSVIFRAKALTAFSWNCLKDITWTYGSGWKLSKGLYYGSPYQQATKTDPTSYIGFECTPDSFVNHTKNSSSKFYTSRSNNMGPYIGTDCSGFVSYCIGISRKTTSTMNSEFNKPGSISGNVRSGDVLYRSNHVLLVASVIREGNTLKGIVLLESRNRTTASGRNIYVYYDNDAILRQLFGDTSFSMCQTILQNVIHQDNTGTIQDFLEDFSGNHTLLRK